MRRYILTGTPGCGKTSIIRGLEMQGCHTVNEAATDVISYRQMQGESEPWKSIKFIDDIIKLQKQRQVYTDSNSYEVYFYDRSPICTYALAKYLGFNRSDDLIYEIERIQENHIYQKQVFFIDNLGSIENTSARTISFEESLKFELVHLGAYDKFGYECIKIPAESVAKRVGLVLAYADDHLG